MSGTEPFAPPSSPASETETIGRVAHLLAHVAHQLPALAASQDTFEDIRRRYGKAMKELAARGEGRVTAPRAEVGAAYSYFSSARDLIKELQTLGWIEPGIPVPASKATVDAHRTRRYPLTADGARVAAITSRRELADELSDALLGHHPYMRALLGALALEPLFCPLAPQGEIQKHPSRRYWVEHLASTLGPENAERYDTHLAEAYRKRFGTRRREGLRPSAKEIEKLYEDAFADLALQARGLRFGATTLEQLAGWGAELKLLDQSRHVPGRQGGNLIWLASEIGEADGRTKARRRTYAEHRLEVAQALIDTYFAERARASEAEDERPRSSGAYQLVHVIRAGAAARTNTARELGDRALEELSNGQLDLGVNVRLLAARIDRPPSSERSSRTRAMHLTITRAGATPADNDPKEH